MKRRVRGRSLALALLVSSLGIGCEKTRHEAPPSPAPCREVGQRCEFAPGKLGACVVRDGCRGDDCFVCQSQH